MLLCDKIEKNYTYYYRNISEKINNSLLQEKSQENESKILKRPNINNVTINVNNNDVIQSNKPSNRIDNIRSTNRRRSRQYRKSRKSRKRTSYFFAH